MTRRAGFSLLTALMVLSIMRMLNQASAWLGNLLIVAWPDSVPRRRLRPRSARTANSAPE